MNNEHLKRNLAIFYHPLFQSIVKKWALAFQVTHNAIDMITFIEINLRVQRVVLSELEIDQSLSSAFTDWAQILHSLSPQNSQPTPSGKAGSGHITRQIKKMIDKIPFELVVLADLYVEFFKQEEQGIIVSYIQDKISLMGFAKFLFDLCCSWCEDLDIELFSFFLLSVLYQITDIKSPGRITLRKFGDMAFFYDPLLTQLRLLKAHYNKYKKLDLVTYEGWYEWNYLPNRIQEMKAKAIEAFLSIFPEDQHIALLIDEVYEATILYITQKNLSKSTTIHFAVLNQDKPPNLERSLEEKFNLEANISGVMNAQKNIHSKTNTSVSKYIGMPVFGKTIQKSEEEMQVHTIKSIAVFQKDAEDSEEKAETQEKQADLYPIWEHEPSENASVMTLNTTSKYEEETPSKDLDVKQTHQTRKKSPNLISKFQKKLSKVGVFSATGQNFNAAEKLYFAQDYFGYSAPPILNNSRSNVSRSSFDPSKTYNENSVSQNLSSSQRGSKSPVTKTEAKINLILQDRNEKKNPRAITPNGLGGRRATKGTKGTLQQVIAEMYSEQTSGMLNTKTAKFYGSVTENMNAKSNSVQKMHRGRILRNSSLDKSEKMNGSVMTIAVVGKSSFQTTEHSDLFTTTDDKYNLDFSLIKSNNLKKSHNQKIPLKPVHSINRKSSNGDGIGKAISNSFNKTPIKFNLRDFKPFKLEKSSSELEKMKETMYKTRLKVNADGESLNPLKDDSSKPIRLATRVGGSRKLSSEVSKEKDPEYFFNKIKQRLEENKRNQNVRMKKMSKPENKKGLHGLNSFERKKLEDSLLNGLLVDSYNTLIE